MIGLITHESLGMLYPGAFVWRRWIGKGQERQEIEQRLSKEPECSPGRECLPRQGTERQCPQEGEERSKEGNQDKEIPKASEPEYRDADLRCHLLLCGGLRHPLFPDQPYRPI